MAPLIRILADDLSGALDAAAPFGAAGGLPVFWQGGEAPAPGQSHAFDARSRSLDLGIAVQRCAEWSAATPPHAIAFKKVDSLFRGNSFAEIAACIRSARFASAVIAPAFPQQNRTTRLGLQYGAPRNDCEPADPPIDLARGLGEAGVAFRKAPDSGAVTGSGVFLCDAVTPADLMGIVAAGRCLAGPVLWIGSAGLARALSPRGPTAEPRALPRPILVICGTRAAATVRQIEVLESRLPKALAYLRGAAPADVEAVAEAVGRRIASGRDAAVALALPATTADEAKRALGLLAARLASLPVQPGTVLATGGDTAAAYCAAAGAGHLLVHGEVAPGVPVAEIVGGFRAGSILVTKSGGFGAAAFLATLLGKPEQGAQ